MARRCRTKSFCSSTTCQTGVLKSYKLVLARPAQFALFEAYGRSEAGFLAINDVIFALMETPRPLGVLTGTVSHRIVGAYRVVYEIDDVARLVTIVDIRQRWKWRVIAGNSFVDEARSTGESMLVDKLAGSIVNALKLNPRYELRPAARHLYSAEQSALIQRRR